MALDRKNIELTKSAQERLKVLEKYLKNRKYEDYVKILNEMIKDPKLKALIEDAAGGDLAYVDLEMSEVDIPVTRLMPTQNEIDLDKSLKYGLVHKGSIPNYFKDSVEIMSPIITYNGTYIVDGHHRWSQVYCFNPKAKMKAINFDGNLSPIQILKSTQLAIAASANKVPVQKVEGKSMYDVSEEEIADYIDNMFAEECVNDLAKCVDEVNDHDSAVDWVLDNAMKLKADNTPIKAAPKRDYMPQTDQAPEALDKLEEGTVALSDSDFTPGTLVSCIAEGDEDAPYKIEGKVSSMKDIEDIVEKNKYVHWQGFVLPKSTADKLLEAADTNDWRTEEVIISSLDYAYVLEYGKIKKVDNFEE